MLFIFQSFLLRNQSVTQSLTPVWGSKSFGIVPWRRRAARYWGTGQTAGGTQRFLARLWGTAALSESGRRVLEVAGIKITQGHIKTLIFEVFWDIKIWRFFCDRTFDEFNRFWGLGVQSKMPKIAEVALDHKHHLRTRSVQSDASVKYFNFKKFACFNSNEITFPRRCRRQFKGLQLLSFCLF